MFGKKCNRCQKRVGGFFQEKNCGTTEKPLCHQCFLAQQQEIKEQKQRKERNQIAKAARKQESKSEASRQKFQEKSFKVSSGQVKTNSSQNDLERLYQAAVRGNIQEVQTHLDSSIDPNAQLPNGDRILVATVGMGDARLNITKALIKGGADINIRVSGKNLFDWIQDPSFCDNENTISYLRSILDSESKKNDQEWADSSEDAISVERHGADTNYLLSELDTAIDTLKILRAKGIAGINEPARNNGLEIMEFDSHSDTSFKAHVRLLVYLKSRGLLSNYKIWQHKLNGACGLAGAIIVSGEAQDILKYSHHTYYSDEAEKFVCDECGNDWNMVNATSSVSDIPAPGCHLDLVGAEESLLSIKDTIIRYSDELGMIPDEHESLQTKSHDQNKPSKDRCSCLKCSKDVNANWASMHEGLCWSCWKDKQPPEDDELSKALPETFVRMLSASEKSVQMKAVRYLAKNGIKGSPEVIAALRHTMNISDCETKCWIAEALLKSGEEIHEKLEGIILETIRELNGGFPEGLKNGLLFSAIGLNEELLALAESALNFSTENINSCGNHENLIPDLERGNVAVENICKIKGIFANAILLAISQMEDYTVSLPQCIYTQEWKIDFSKRRKRAIAEIKRRHIRSS